MCKLAPNSSTTSTPALIIVSKKGPNKANNFVVPRDSYLKLRDWLPTTSPFSYNSCEDWIFSSCCSIFCPISGGMFIPSWLIISTGEFFVWISLTFSSTSTFFMQLSTQHIILKICSRIAELWIKVLAVNKRVSSFKPEIMLKRLPNHSLTIIATSTLNCAAVDRYKALLRVLASTPLAPFTSLPLTFITCSSRFKQ